MCSVGIHFFVKPHPAQNLQLFKRHLTYILLTYLLTFLLFKREKNYAMIHQKLQDDTKDYWISSIPRLHRPSTIDFLRQMMTYHPFIITGVVEEWTAYRDWNISSIGNKIGLDTHIPITLTPDGLADSVKVINSQESLSIDGDESSHIEKESSQEMFTFPIDTEIPYKVLMNMLQYPELNDAIPYLSQQNDNFRTCDCFRNLRGDIPEFFSTMDEAFNDKILEAVNIWIGDERSVSSLHKDHYENIYAVISGDFMIIHCV